MERLRYHRIAKALQDDFGSKTAPNSIRNFVKVSAEKIDLPRNIARRDISPNV